MRDQSGQATIETALLLPVLLLLVLGILEFGRVYSTKQAVTEAARAGARSAAVLNPSVTRDSVRATIARTLSRSGIPGVAVKMDFDTAAPPQGHWRETGAMQTVYVGVQYRFGFFAPLVKAALGKETITIGSLVTMRNE